jgi:hypothetical protein
MTAVPAKKPKLTDESDVLRGFTSFWMAQVNAAVAHKKPFTKIAEICSSFYKKASGFMWENDFKSQYLDRVEVPKFAVTLQKAFELVALFGPYLYWQNPHRRVAPLEPMLFSEDAMLLFADPNLPEEMWQSEFQMLMEEQQRHTTESKYRAMLMEQYLNYSQREQPGGLAKAATFAITEALIKGRGCLWPEKYSFSR